MSNSYRFGVGIMMLNSKKEVFVGERRDCKYALQMPQGGIDYGETPNAAMHREAMEEIGTVNFIVLLESKTWFKYDFPIKIRNECFAGKYIGQQQKWFLLRFLGEDTEINIHTKSSEFINWQWINIDDLEKVIIDFKKPLYKNIMKEFKPLIHNYFNEVIRV